eukprot:1189728-Prymnesium_polylepis.2
MECTLRPHKHPAARGRSVARACWASCCAIELLAVVAQQLRIGLAHCVSGKEDELLNVCCIGSGLRGRVEALPAGGAFGLVLGCGCLTLGTDADVRVGAYMHLQIGSVLCDAHVLHCSRPVASLMHFMRGGDHRARETDASRLQALEASSAHVLQVVPPRTSTRASYAQVHDRRRGAPAVRPLDEAYEARMLLGRW